MGISAGMVEEHIVQEDREQADMDQGTLEKCPAQVKDRAPDAAVASMDQDFAEQDKTLGTLVEDRALNSDYKPV